MSGCNLESPYLGLGVGPARPIPPALRAGLIPSLQFLTPVTGRQAQSCSFNLYSCLAITMSLYYDAAPLLLSTPGAAGSLKSRVFSSKNLKSPSKQVFALVSEASKWSPVLADVVERSQLLQLERKVCISNQLLR